MTEGPHDKEIAELIHLSGNIMIRYNSLNAALSTYIVKCQTGAQDIQEIYKVLNRRGKNGKPPYRFTEFVKCLKDKGELFMKEDDLLDILDRMRVIRNSIAHWMLGKANDGTFGIVDAENRKTIDVKTYFNEFIHLYGKINEPLSKIL